MTEPDSGPAVPNVVAEEPAGTGQPVAPVEDSKPIYWQELESLPQDVRPLVEPIFKEWDSNVAKRLQGVHSEYEPYKSLVDEWEADALSQAIQLAQALESDPVAFAQRLIEAYNIDLGQGAAQPSQSDLPDDDDPDALPDDPRFARLDEQEQLLTALAQAVLSEREEKEFMSSQQQLDAVLAELQTAHGDFDESFVLTQIANGIDPAQAVANFQAAVGAYAAKTNAPNLNAPAVLGQGGGYPSQQVDPASLSTQDTEALIVQMLRAANQQG